MEYDQSRQPQQIRQMFGRIARRYDLNNRLHSMGRDRKWRLATARLAQLKPGKRALDVACGTGELTAMLADQVAPGPAVIGLDFCEPMLEVARRKYPDHQIEFVLGDAHQLPFEDNRFDAVTIAFGLRNLDQPPVALAEMVRVLRPGGRLIVLEFVPDQYHISGRAIAWFVRHVIPFSAGLIAGDRNAYKYLPKSIQSFLRSNQVAEALGQAGLSQISLRRLAGGAVVLAAGVK